jgi:hypothetical protein
MLRNAVDVDGAARPAQGVRLEDGCHRHVDRRVGRLEAENTRPGPRAARSSPSRAPRASSSNGRADGGWRSVRLDTHAETKKRTAPAWFPGK